ncbi:universal stress protein [Kitasatospora sp. NPDC127111]|uniref:universal stress protein n=1 Tax=Kitasatospora sp. NPDC127111 TaxID=3345363 RepID=UPI0036318CBE
MGSSESPPRIVVGLDGSPSSHAALRWAVKHAKLVGGVVDAVTGWEFPALYGWSAPAVPPDLDVDVAHRRLAEELDKVLGEDRPVEVRPHVVRANPAEALLDAAQGAEALVVGSRGRGTFARALLGSVSQQCALHAPCPVVIVRPQ